MTAQDPTTNNPFDAKQQATLSALAVLIIPPSVEYNIPGADDSQIFENIVTLCEQKAWRSLVKRCAQKPQYRDSRILLGQDSRGSMECVSRDSQ